MSTDRPAASGAQTLHRALDVVEAIATGGRSLSIAEIAAETALAAPTAHRLCRALVERGYLRQLSDRSYALGIRLVALGNAANELIGAGAVSTLARLVEQLGETANLAVLTGQQAEYVAQSPSKYTMRTFTEVGRRVDLHSTGVGKALLAQLDDDEVVAVLRRTGLPRSTAHTITTRAALAAELTAIRAQGYALDEQEQELGVRCVAVAVRHPSLTWMALSVSGPVTRMTDAVVTRSVPALRAAADRLATDLLRTSAT